MDPKLRDTTTPLQPQKIDGVLIGRLIQAVENNTATTTILCEQVNGLKKEQTRVAVTFEHINHDIIEIRKSIDSKPGKDDIINIVDKRLENYGLDNPRESSYDAIYVREKRKNGMVLKQRVTIAVTIMFVAGAISWAGTAMYEKIKQDIKQEQTR